MSGHSADSNPEELLDVFKAAALSVTKLFKTSTAAQSKARVDGYQDCLEDLLAVIDKGDADVRSIRRWVLERLDGRESVLSTIESEDETDKADNGSTPEPHNTRHGVTGSTINGSRAVDTPMQTLIESEMDTETETVSPVKSRTKTRTAGAASTASATSTPTLSSSAPVSAMAALAAGKKAAKAKAKAQAQAQAQANTPTAPSSDMAEAAGGAVPMQAETGSGDFLFRSSVPYPTDSFLELANLDLSDRRSGSGAKEQTDVSSVPYNSTSTSNSPNPNPNNTSNNNNNNNNSNTPSSTTFIFNAPANNTSDNA